MTKTIDTLVKDIYDVVSEGTDVPDQLVEDFGKDVARIAAQRLSPAERREEGYLRLSNLGHPCGRRIYFDVHHPDLGEPLAPYVRLKFLIGDLWESMLLFLAKAAGHSVEGEQDTLEVEGVPGHRDAVIDGVTVDVKSASKFAFKKFKSGLTLFDDSFGYITQLNAYIEAGQNDPIVTNKDEGAFLVGEKEGGYLHLDKHKKKPFNYEELVASRREMLEQPEPPERGFSDEEFGKSGNRALGVVCSYCRYKTTCWPGLRTFLYKRGDQWKPTHLTVVAKRPQDHIPEVPTWGCDDIEFPSKS